MIIFEVESATRKKIRLTQAQWMHITTKHKEFNKRQLSKIMLTATEPDLVLYSPHEDNYQYCKWFEKTPVTRKYLLLVIKHLNSEAFIITAFFVSEVNRKNKVVFYGE